MKLLSGLLRRIEVKLGAPGVPSQRPSEVLCPHLCDSRGTLGLERWSQRIPDGTVSGYGHRSATPCPGARSSQLRHAMVDMDQLRSQGSFYLLASMPLNGASEGLGRRGCWSRAPARGLTERWPRKERQEAGWRFEAASEVI